MNPNSRRGERPNPPGSGASHCSHNSHPESGNTQIPREREFVDPLRVIPVAAVAAVPRTRYNPPTQNHDGAQRRCVCTDPWDPQNDFEEPGGQGRARLFETTTLGC